MAVFFDTITNFFTGSAVGKLADNFNVVKDFFDNRLFHRDGSRTMQGNLDMDGRRVINSGQPVDDNDLATFRQVKEITQGPPGLPGEPGSNVMAISDFADLPNLSIPIGTNILQTAGATRGILIADSSLTEDDRTLFPNCVVRTLNGRYFRRDERNLNLAQLGLSGGTADDTPVVREAIDYLARFGFTSDPIFKNAPKLTLPAGIIRMDNAVSLKTVVVIEGQGNGMDGGTGTLFVCRSSGFILDRADTSFGVGVDVTTTGSDGSILRNFAMVYAGSKSFNPFTGDHGINVKARATISDLRVEKFSGNGINIVASARGSGGTGSDIGNANNFVIERVTANSNYHGIYVRGADANAGSGFALNCNFNAGCGLLDQSFLGNTWLGCHSSANGLAYNNTAPSVVTYNGARYTAVQGADTLWSTTVPGTNENVWRYFEDGPVIPGLPTWISGATYKFGAAYATINRNCRSVFVGCYVEGTQAPPQVAWPSMAIGGLFNQMGDGIWLNGEQASVNAQSFSSSGAFLNNNEGGALGLSGGTSTFRMKSRGPDVRVDWNNSDVNIPFFIRGPGTADPRGANTTAFQGIIGMIGGGGLTSFEATQPASNLPYPAIAFNSQRRVATAPVGWSNIPGTTTWIPFGAQAS